MAIRSFPFLFCNQHRLKCPPTVPSLPVRFDKLNYQSHMSTRHSEIGQMPLQGLVNMTNHDSGEHLRLQNLPPPSRQLSAIL